MSSTYYTLQLPDHLIPVTPDDIRKVRQFFRRGCSDGTEGQELLHDIVRILRQLVGKNKRTDPNNHKIIAMVVKELTTNRTVKEAREYLRSNKGTEWLRQLVIPKVSTVAPEITGVDSIPETPTTIQTRSDEVIDIDNNVFGVPQPAIMAPAATQPFVPKSPSQSSSLAGVGVSTQRCPLRDQIHPNGLVILLSVAEMLQQHGYSPEFLGRSTATSRRQPNPLSRNPSPQQRLESDAAAMWLRLLVFSVSILAFAIFIDIVLRLLSR